MNRPFYPALLTYTLILSEVLFIIALFLMSRAFLDSININETSKGPVFVIVWPFKGILVLGLLLMCIRLPIQIIQAVKSIKAWGRAE